MPEQPKLTPEQAVTIKKMIDLSKRIRLVFFISLAIGLLTGTLYLIFMWGVCLIIMTAAFIATLVSALLLRVNVSKLKNYMINNKLL